MRITQGGNVGIGTSSPDMLLAVGSNTPTGSIAHFENSTGSCYINPTTSSLSCSSDSRLKTNVVALPDADGLDALLKLNPVTFNWKNESATTSPHTGFIAQDVQPVLPDLISSGPDGFLTMNYAGLAPYLVKAVQEIASVSGSFKDALVAWLGNASNGIGDLFANNVYAHNVTGDKLCAKKSDGTSVCMTGDQLAALLSQSATAGLANPTPAGTTSPADPASPTPPVIQINGDNPARIQVGASYIDLGATITGPAADLNLGIKTFLNGALVSNIVLDTTAAATNTIDYVVTDQSGLTSTSTRTVIVEAPQPQTSPPSATTSPAITTASSAAQ